jgi:hypothetical protein
MQRYRSAAAEAEVLGDLDRAREYYGVAAGAEAVTQRRVAAKWEHAAAAGIDAGPEMGGVEEGNEQGAGLRLCVDENGVEWESI